MLHYWKLFLNQYLDWLFFVLKKKQENITENADTAKILYRYVFLWIQYICPSFSSSFFKKKLNLQRISYLKIHFKLKCKHGRRSSIWNGAKEKLKIFGKNFKMSINSFCNIFSPFISTFPNDNAVLHLQHLIESCFLTFLYLYWLFCSFWAVLLLFHYHQTN